MFSKPDDNNDIDNIENDGYCLPVMVSQFTGKINVGEAPSSILQRKVKIDFVCDILFITVCCCYCFCIFYFVII